MWDEYSTCNICNLELMVNIYIYLEFSGDFNCALHNTTIFGGDGVFKATKMQQEHVRQWDSEDDMLRNGGVHRQKCEDFRNKEWGKWVLCAVANAPWNVVFGIGRRRE